MHDELVKDATHALDRIHSDTTVSLEQTLESLEMLCDRVEMLIEAVREDIVRREDSNRDMWP